jgi:diguanylate cyclase (GGDEF)-like protein/PAS domain S-box-containing protein
MIQKINLIGIYMMNHTEMKESDLNQAIDNTEISFDERLTYDKLSFYYISLPIMLLGNILGAFLLSAMQINIVDLYSISIWLLVSIIMFIYQVYHYYKFKNETEENKLKNAEVWLDKYYTNILLNGIIWGSSAFLLFPESDLTNQMIVMLFLFAIGFASMGVLAAKRDLLLTYVLVTYSPLILRLFFLEGELYTKITYVILSLILILILIANYYGKIINNSLNTRQHFITIQHTHEKLKERFFSLFERAPVGIYYFNKNLKLEDVNTHFMQMNKAENKEKLIGFDLNQLNNQKIIQAHEAVFEGKTKSERGPFKSLNNGDLYVKLSTVPMLNADGEVVAGITIINDITNEVTAKEKMIRNAYYDLLTNIPNRTLLMDNLKSFIANDMNHETFAALIFLDINNFKKINESFGHDVGDNLLKQVVQRMEENLKEGETFARVSGDKFVILIPSLYVDKALSEKKILQYITNIKESFMHPLNIIGEEYHLSFTTGIVLFNSNNASAFELLKQAETAMYEAKKNAKGTVQFYEASMSAYKKDELMLENDIYKAMKNNELIVYYQPQLDVQTNKIIGAEALIRWSHPERGFISPATFIPLAEESGVIITLEEWIFDKVLSEIKLLSQRENGFNLNHIAINVSTIHFLQPHFVERFMLLVNKHKVKPEWIELEITESGIMRNIDDGIKKIEELKNFGFSFSIDDFGTGHSSLAYLKKLPVDVIKIDQSFIFHMYRNKGDAMIVESVVAIGQKFNFKIVAEGVENSETLAYLKKIKCDIYQGHLAYKPMPLIQFQQII